MEFFDSHSHYNDERFNEDREQIIKETYEDGITKIVCAGYDIPSSKLSIELSKKYEFIYSIIGISPNDVPESETQIDSEIEKVKEMLVEETKALHQNEKLQLEKNSQTKQELQIEKSMPLKSKKIVAIGEIGLDYYWNKENKEIQKEMFIKQIELANEYNLPIVIHTREAVDDTIDILKNKCKVNKAGIFHCCPLNRELVKQALNLGFYISFAGPITFKNSKNAEEIVKMVPTDKMLIETDSPYLAPEPKRGTRNDCRNVKYIAQKIAEYKNIELEKVAKITYENACRIFNI